MKNCDDYDLMIADVLAGRLDEQSASEFEAHLEICAVCQASFERFERTALILNDAYPASSTENAKIWTRVEESLGSKRVISGRSNVATISPWAPLFGAAAMVALAVLLFLFSPGAQKASTVADAQPSVKKDSKDIKDGKDNRRESASKLTRADTAVFEKTPQITQPAKESNPPPSVALSVQPMVPDVAPEHVANPQPTAATTSTTRGPREIIDDSRGLALLRRTGAVAIFDANHQAWRPIVAGERVPYGTAVRTGAGALAELAFGESRVRLDEKTEVTIASAEARVAELSHGRLRVDLLRSERPFRIRSGGGTVELTGTVVDVDAPAPDLAFVRVLEGHVKVDQAWSDSNSDRPALPVAIDHEALVAFRAPDSILEALPQPVRSRALNLAHDRGHAAFSDPNVKNWTDPLDHPPSKSDAAVGQLIVKDEQGHEAAPLSVARMDIEASVRGPESITRIDQSFLNTTDRTLEGTFYFPLPPGAAISRFAMYVDPKTLIEGEVVERGKARAIFNSILRQRRDPALLEWMEGNLFKARIFPIAPHSEKRVILEYTQLLPAFYDTRRYVFPLVSELTEKSPIGKLSVRVNLATGDGSRFEEVYSPSYSRQTQVQGLGCANAVATLNLSNIKPNADFVLTFSAPRPSELFSTAYAEKDEQPYALLGYEPRLARGEGSGVRGQGTANGRDILFLVETSGTRSTQDLDAQRRVLESMLSGLDPAADRVALAAADIGITQLSDGFQSIDAADVGNAMQSLKQRVPLGGLDLGASLREASDLFGLSARKRMILFVGAGVPALGTLDSGKLVEEVSGQLAHGRTSFTAVAIGHSVESLTLSELARRSGGFYVPLKVDEGLDEAAFQLGLSLQSPLIELPVLKSAGDTLTEIYPTQLGSLLPGQEVFVHGRLPLASSPHDAVHLSVSATLNGAPFSRNFDVSLPRHLDADPPVGRFWARARLDYLLTQPQSETQRHEVINLAQTWTLMSPYTSFLVLESNDDYKRYDIDRSKRRPAWKDAPIEIEPRIELAEKLSRDINELGRKLGRPIQDQIVISSGEFAVDLTGKLNLAAPKSGGEYFDRLAPVSNGENINVAPYEVSYGLLTPEKVPSMMNRTVVAPHLHWKARQLDAAYANNLILVGTKENPININQQTVVKGDIIIKGYYTGAGSLWAQGNLYLPSDKQYRSASYSPKDSGKAPDNIENLGGLVAGGTIIIGDYLVTSANRLKIDDAAMSPDLGLLVTGRTDSAEPLISVHRAYALGAEGLILDKMDFATPEPQDDVFKNVHYDLSLTPDTIPTGADYIDNGVYNFANLFDPNVQKLKDVVLKQQQSVVVNPVRGKQAHQEKNELERELNSAESRRKEEIQAQASAHLEAGKRLFNSFQYEEARKEFESANQLDRATEENKHWLIRTNDILGVRRDRIKSTVAQLYGEHKVAVQEKIAELDNRVDWAKRYMDQAQSDPDLSASDRVRKYQQGQLALERARELIKYLPSDVKVEEQNDEVNRLLTQTGKDIAAAEKNLQETDREEAARLSTEHAASEKRFFEKKVNKMTDEASSLFEVGQFDEAVGLAKKITEIDPTNPEAHSIIATARERAHVEKRKFIDEEYKEQFELNREHADRLNIPHRDYLIYPDNWQEITERTLDNRYGPNATVSETAGQNDNIKGHDAKIQNPTETTLFALRTKNFLGTDYDTTRHETHGRKEVGLAAKDDTIRQQEALIAQEKADSDKLHSEHQQLGAVNNMLVERNANAIAQLSDYDEKATSNLGQPALKMYDVRDLSKSITDFPGPRIEIDAANKLPEKTTPEVDYAQALNERIKKELPNSTSSVALQNGQLVVMATPDEQEKVRKLIEEQRAIAATTAAIKDGASEPQPEKSSSELMRERLLLLLQSTKLTPETRLQVYQKLVSISSGVDTYRALADGIAEFKSEGPQAEALAHEMAQRIRGEQDAKVLDQILDTKSALVKQDKEQTHGPEAHATITDTGLRARMFSRRAELESDPAKRCEFCQRAYSESENDATYLRPLVESFLAGSQNQPAVKYIEESLRQGAAEAWMYPTLAKAYAALGDVKNSMRALTQDVALRPREGAPRIELARAFDALGRGPEAVRELRAACEFAFESAAAHRELLAMANKYHDNDAREWVLLAMLGSMWLSQDGDVWGEARRDFDALNNELKDAGKFDHIKELAAKRKIAEANDIVAVMKWDTNQTDIDLHVIEPGDQRVSYSSRTSFRGGMLDHDNTSGYGPETYTLKRGAPGHYLIKVHFYSGNVSTNVNVIVTRKQGSPEESVQTFDVKLKHAGDEAKIIEFDIP